MCTKVSRFWVQKKGKACALPQLMLGSCAFLTFASLQLTFLSFLTQVLLDPEGGLCQPTNKQTIMSGGLLTQALLSSAIFELQAGMQQLNASLMLKATEPEIMMDSGDTAWVLTCTCLVLMMTVPGLALFYGGLSQVYLVQNSPHKHRASTSASDARDSLLNLKVDSPLPNMSRFAIQRVCLSGISKLKNWTGQYQSKTGHTGFSFCKFGPVQFLVDCWPVRFS